MGNFCNLIPYFCDDLSAFFASGGEWNDSTAAMTATLRPQSATSFKSIIHYLQLISTGVFKQYDYGSDEENEKNYGSATVPLLNLGNIGNIPIALLVGAHDDLGDPEDSRVLSTELKNVVKYKEYDDMDHFSFVVGKDMKYVDDMITILSEYG